MKIPKVSPKRWRLLKGMMGSVGTGIGRFVTSEAGAKTALGAAKKGASAFKRGAKSNYGNAALQGLKTFGKELGTGFAKVATASPKKSLKQAHAIHMRQMETKWGTRTKIERKDDVPGAGWHPKGKREYMDQAKFSARKIAGVDYKRTPEEVAYRTKILGRVTKGLTGTGVVTVAAYNAEKVQGKHYVEHPKYGKLTTEVAGMSLNNPEGSGGRADASVKYRHPAGHVAEVGAKAGFGHAQKAGWAHQLGVYGKVHTPWLRTGLEATEQHAFGNKSRSRRVAAISRAVFKNEQHLGAVPGKRKRGPKPDVI